MKPLHWAILASVVVILTGYLAWTWASGPPSPERLAKRALTAGTLPERSKAAAELVLRKDLKAMAQIRRLVTESKDPEIQVIAISTLASRADSESLPLFITAMEDEAKPVREAAIESVLRLTNGSLPDNLIYQADDPPDKRSRVVNQLKDFYAKGGPPPER